MSFYIYKYVENNEIIYIGQTVSIHRRIDEHRSSSDKLYNFQGEIYYFECNNKIEMDSYEYFLINKYHPKYNVLYNNDNLSLNIEEPIWIKYNSSSPKEKYSNRKNFNGLSTASEIDNLPFKLQYKIDIKQKLKEKGYNTTAIRNTGLFGQQFLKSLNHGYMQFSPITLKRLCIILNCQPGDLLEVIEDNSN